MSKKPLLRVKKFPWGPIVCIERIAIMVWGGGPPRKPEGRLRIDVRDLENKRILAYSVLRTIYGASISKKGFDCVNALFVKIYEPNAETFY